MSALLYIRLIGYTAGTLLMLFWMVVILGYRRQRNFERVFFFFCLALFLFYSGSLLALNAQIYYPNPPLALSTFAFSLLALGLSFLPGLLVHLHLEYLETRNQLRRVGRKNLQIAFYYASAIYFLLSVYPTLSAGGPFDFLQPGHILGNPYGLVLSLSLLSCCVWEAVLLRKSLPSAERFFHGFTAFLIGLAALLVIFVHVRSGRVSPQIAAGFSTILALLPILPLSALVYLVRRFNFLQIGRQKNLVYAVCVTFFALLYLSLVRRVSTWLEPVLPPEASAAILVYVLVIFFEPLQRALSRRLRHTVQDEVDRAQRLLAEIQEIASRGELKLLQQSIESAVRQHFELARVRFILASETSEQNQPPQFNALETAFPIRRGGQSMGILYVLPYGGMISGETTATLEFLCEQLPSAIELCRVIREKLELERELAERERMATLGQMAASISHNLKNPLGSIKTILQVQLENSEFPESLRGETRLMLDEISRLSTKLNQLLQFSRPAVLGEAKTANCNAAEVAREVASVLRHDADRKGLALQLISSAQSIAVSAPSEAVRDILSNLVVNALDATPSGGRIDIDISQRNGHCEVAVTDNGPGIPADLREKVLQPFFTTKAHGTGLGLAIVARRVAEVGGTLDVQSPVQDGHGTRFFVRLPLAQNPEKKRPLNA